MDAFSHLSPEEWRILVERSSYGEAPVFSGEERTTSPDPRHAVLSGRNFEVTPAELIEGAKHIAMPDENPSATMIRAHALICEAHLLARNLRHWNEAQDRHHASAVIDKLVKEHEITKGPGKGRVPKTDLLRAFLKHRKVASNPDDAEKTFNEWIKHSVRTRDFLSVIPHDPSREGFDRHMYDKLVANGWIRRVHIGSSVWLLPPVPTEPPAGRPRRKLRDGEHPTRPYWETKKVWWPTADESEVKRKKLEYLTTDSRRFRSTMTATWALQRLGQWLDALKAWSEAHPTSRKRKRTKTGKFARSGKKGD